MKFQLILLICLLGGPFLPAQLVEYDRYGRVSASTPINEAGEFEGIAYHYYPSGAISAETPYQQGLRHGLERSYYADGQLKAECPYAYDLYEGEYVGYYENGAVKIRQTWKAGQKTGETQVFYPNGRLRMYAWMEADSVCFAQRFDPEGRLVYEQLRCLDTPIDTAYLGNPQVFFAETPYLKRGHANTLQVVIPRVPSAYLSFASADGRLLASHQDSYSFAVVPEGQGDTYLLYVRIKTHAQARPSMLRILRLAVR